MNNPLADYVAKVMNDDRLSGYNIERRTQGEITQSYVLRIKNGTAKNVSMDKLKVLAKGLGRPAAEVIAVAMGTPLKDDAHTRLSTLEFTYEGLTPEKKEKADYLIELLEREIQRIESEE